MSDSLHLLEGVLDLRIRVSGCIRLWDVKKADDDPLNGTTLAKVDYDIATFCLGDVYKDEIPIIVYATFSDICNCH